MRFAVGQTVHHKATNDPGRIVRIVNVKGLAYIVTTQNKVSNSEIEALWRPKELKEVSERAERLSRTKQSSESPFPVPQ